MNRPFLCKVKRGLLMSLRMLLTPQLQKQGWHNERTALVR